MNKLKAAILSFILVLMCGQAFAQTASLLPPALQQFLDNDGNPLSSGTVDFYIPNTSTRKNTWSDATETTVNTNPVVLDAAGRPNGGKQIYGNGQYRQVLKDSLGNTIWDKVTSSTLGPGSVSLVGDGAAVGSVKPWAGIVAPAQYVFAYGQELNRTTYANLLSAITQTLVVACTNTSATITGISDTSQIPPGANVELSCVPAGTTVVSKTASTMLLSNPSNITVNATGVFFPYGNGNGTTTFKVPDLRARTLVGRSNMGGTDLPLMSLCNENATGSFCGQQSEILTQANLPALTLTTSIAAGQGSHNHTLATAINVANGGGAAQGVIPGAGAGTNVSTSTLPAMTGTTPIGGSGTAVTTIQPTFFINYVVKVLPDSSISTSTVVTSIQGMTGDLTCGANMTCSGGVISSTGGGGGGVPAGSNTQVQFNSTGGFGASANLTWINPTLTIGAAGTTGNLSIAGTTSGAVTQTVQSVAGSVTVTWGNLSGTPAVTATSPLAIASTGNIACTTCALTTNPLSQFAATTSTQLAGIISDETGSGSLVFSASPTLTAPTLGVATATSINGLTLTASTGTFTLTNAKTFSVANSIAIAGVDASTITFQATDTYVGRSTTDTLTNKTLDTAGTGNVFKIAGTTITAIAGNTATVGTTSGVLTSGHCVSIDANLNFIDAGGACTTGGGGGTVNAATAGQIAYYGTSSTIVSGNPNLTISTGALTVGLAGSVQGTVKIAGATSGTTTIAVAAAASGTLTLPSATDTLVGKTTTDTLTNKTLTAPVIATIVNSGTLTLPTSTDTLIGKATTDTLTNKTYNTAGTGNAFSINGQSITSVSGNTTKVATTSGTLTNNDCVSIDASGNLVDAGAACATLGANTVTNSVLAQMPANTFKCNNTTSTANASDCAGAGLDQNILLSKTANYTLTAADCGSTVALGGNAFFILTVPVVAGFPAVCSVNIANVDGWTSGRGKTISGISLPSGTNAGLPNILWPTQTINLKIVNGTWTLFYAPIRVKHTAGIIFNTDFTNGINTNDGLATGATGAFKTVEQCLTIIYAIFDDDAGNNSVTCLMAAGSTDSTQVHVASHGGFPGSFGTSGIIIDGNTTGALTGGVQAFYGSVIALQNITLSNAGGSVLFASLGGHISTNGGVTLATAGSGGALLEIENGATISFNNNLTWSGGTSGFFVLAQYGSIFQGNSITVNLTNAATVTDTIACNYNSTCNANGMTWTLNAHVVTATHSYLCSGNAVIIGAAGIPGTGAASTGSGCQAL